MNNVENQNGISHMKSLHTLHFYSLITIRLTFKMFQIKKHFAQEVSNSS